MLDWERMEFPSTDVSVRPLGPCSLPKCRARGYPGPNLAILREPEAQSVQWVGVPQIGGRGWFSARQVLCAWPASHEANTLALCRCALLRPRIWKIKTQVKKRKARWTRPAKATVA